MKQLVKKVVSTDGDSFPESLEEVISLLQYALNRIPLGHQGRLDIHCGDGYMEGFEVWYLRPETDEEEAARIRSEAGKCKAEEIAERALLAKLLAKYPQQ